MPDDHLPPQPRQGPGQREARGAPSAPAGHRAVRAAVPLPRQDPRGPRRRPPQPQGHRPGDRLGEPEAEQLAGQHRPRGLRRRVGVAALRQGPGLPVRRLRAARRQAVPEVRQGLRHGQALRVRRHPRPAADARDRPLDGHGARPREVAGHVPDDARRQGDLGQGRCGEPGQPRPRLRLPAQGPAAAAVQLRAPGRAR